MCCILLPERCEKRKFGKEEIPPQHKSETCALITVVSELIDPDSTIAVRAPKGGTNAATAGRRRRRNGTGTVTRSPPRKGSTAEDRTPQIRSVSNYVTKIKKKETITGNYDTLSF
ncbi:hypothetical protein QE152_g35847 [Popillia japonica]|uniref:Uncharacterized protein n=1 Tax=Popillia japonica TaxID=7064 RepID=A0AAW1IEQ1_POPJA